jgi:hypothetical protein
MRVFLPTGTHLHWRVTGMGKIYTRWRVWIRVMGKIKGDGYGYGVVPPTPIPCGCHPYTSSPSLKTTICCFSQNEISTYVVATFFPPSRSWLNKFAGAETNLCWRQFCVCRSPWLNSLPILFGGWLAEKTTLLGRQHLGFWTELSFSSSSGSCRHRLPIFNQVRLLYHPTR